MFWFGEVGNELISAASPAIARASVTANLNGVGGVGRADVSAK